MTVIRAALAALACLLLMVGIVPAAAQDYGFLTAIGNFEASVGQDNGHFNQPYQVAADPTHNHLFISDSVNQRVQVYDSRTLAYVGTIGMVGVVGTGNDQFDLPAGLAVDAANDHLLVPDIKNNRVQVYSTENFAYLSTLGADDGTAGSDNAHFKTPASVAVDAADGQVLVADSGNRRIQVYNASTLTYSTTLSETGAGQFVATEGPVGLTIDPVNGHILIVDLLRNCVEVIKTSSFDFVGEVGVCDGAAGSGNGEFDLPFGAAVDTANNRILVADTLNNRVEVFDAGNFGFVEVLDTTDGPLPAGGLALFQPNTVFVDPATDYVYVADTLNNRVQVYGTPAVAPPPPQVVGAVLPGGRSVALGTQATIFGVIINTGPETLECGIAGAIGAPPGLEIAYQQTNTLNQPIGALEQPAFIPPGGMQNFLIIFQATQALTAKALPVLFDCVGSPLPVVVPGVNTVDLSFSATPGADVIALAATASGNNTIGVPVGGSNGFSVAAINLGAQQNLTVSADFGGAALPASVSVCPTNAKGMCLLAPTPSLQQSFAPNAVPTFSVFVSASAAVPLDPAHSRVFLRFTDAEGMPHGSTSVAVTTQ
jgi:DNA-binding beta-propeller fold protein YncE